MTQRRKAVGLTALLLALTMLFAGLGVWQVRRLQWKLALIESVDRKLSLAPVELPPRAEWPKLATPDWEYRRVRVEGRYRGQSTTLVDALTELGPGFWVMTPLDTTQGPVWINRGFVTKDRAASLPAASAKPVSITGLLRLPEPGGRFLRPNRPAEGRWFSRDVAALSTFRDVRASAPVFIDADRQPGPGESPIGGLTVTTFRNNHLAYALTWFALAALCLFGVWKLSRENW